jgi:hypothetical protein
LKFTVEQITESSEEEVFVKCYDTQTVWVENIHKVVSGQNVIGAYKNGAFFRLEMSDIYYFSLYNLFSLSIVISYSHSTY